VGRNITIREMKNDLGVDPNEWFRESIPMNEHPPNSDEYHSPLPTPDWEDTAPSEYEPPYENPLDSMPIARDSDDWFTDKPKKKDETMHEKMYKIATSRYNPFSVGGSENCDSDISCNLGGSEQIQR
tara:strand:+ start:13 stop:393 length:381 start_codon:yes stop_codon:yes gene_type:complete